MGQDTFPGTAQIQKVHKRMFLVPKPVLSLSMNERSMLACFYSETNNSFTTAAWPLPKSNSIGVS